MALHYCILIVVPIYVCPKRNKNSNFRLCEKNFINWVSYYPINIFYRMSIWNDFRHVIQIANVLSNYKYLFKNWLPVTWFPVLKLSSKHSQILAMVTDQDNKLIWIINLEEWTTDIGINVSAVSSGRHRMWLEKSKIPTFFFQIFFSLVYCI